MAIDLVCGQCAGRLLAEQPGSVVACPHCGTHLQVPEGDAANGEPAPEEALGVESPTAIAETGDVSSELEPAEEFLSAPVLTNTVEMVRIDGALLVEEPTVDFLPTSGPTPLSELPSHSSPRMPVAEAPAPPLTPSLPTPAQQPAAAAVMPAIDVGANAVPAMVPRFWFFVVASYASAVTLAFIFLLLTLGRMKTHPLENLPDVVPKIQKGEVALEVAPPDADVAPGHVLALGETRRFGSLNVTPLRVSQGPLRFEHVLNDPKAARLPSAPVLKLWLKFENVSRNQQFMPLDPLLLFKRHYQDFGKDVLTNQFLRRESDRRNGKNLHYVFELSATSEFRIAGQQLESELGPGQTLETFIPSEEAIDDLTGELVWRVQFRKGYHPRTFHGVTTLIDVPFRRNDVQQDI